MPDNQLEELRKEHQILSQAVENEQQNPAADNITITEMKKRKLLLKEQIAQLSRN